MQFYAFFISAILGFGLLPMAQAHQDDHQGHEHAHRHHGAHVHGMATLDLVLDGEEMMMHLQSPLMNFLGFEHAPETEQQQSAYQEMMALLKRLDTLLEVEGADCVAESIDVEDPFDNSESDGHADIDVSYFLRCLAPENITSLKINLFDIYHQLETIEVQMVLPHAQQQLKLNPQRTTIRVN